VTPKNLPCYPQLAVDLLTDAPWPVRVIRETKSTNASMRKAAIEGQPEQVLVAEHQTEGRGRLDRSWIAPPMAGLTFSLLLRPQLPPSKWSQAAFVAGIAVRRAFAGQVDLKWPNDVMIGERKLGGLLAESLLVDSPALVMGIGLNVQQKANQLPVPQATSCALEGLTTDRTQLLITLLHELSRAFAQWGRGEWPQILAEYRDACQTIGREVRAELPGPQESGPRESGGLLVGRAIEVADDGRLVVLSRGKTHYVSAGDIVQLQKEATEGLL
jgi:BirA family transcriptional regulator, biotin operon repressor / biotin---[acetyl-CoA-carboxylase] ligase